jgi:hypothetical protein
LSFPVSVRLLFSFYRLKKPKPLMQATTTLPFVIPTGAQRSGEIRGFLISKPQLWTITSLPLCHLDRSAAQRRDLRLPIPKPQLRATTSLPLVISTGA